VQCAETITRVTSHEARLILEPYFEELQEEFVLAGLERVQDTKLRCSSSMHDSSRHFAGCLEDGRIIYAAPELVEMPPETVLGILAHELGHAADFLYPGEFVLRGDHVIAEEPDRHRLRGWKRRQNDTVEVTADLIAEWVLGTSIGYRGPCLLQTLGTLGPRPKGLR